MRVLGNYAKSNPVIRKISQSFNRCPFPFAISIIFGLVIVIVVHTSISLPSIALTEEETVPKPNNLKFACDTFSRSHAFCNTSLPIKIRVQDIIKRLTLREKVGQLSSTAEAIERLGIPSYEWWSESLHGIGTDGPGVRFNGTIKSATNFPQVILTAASFNETLWTLIARAVGIEARAMYNFGQAGLTFWAPNVNIFRDPRWGRGQETPGEDPFTAARYAVAYVRGFQGEDIVAHTQEPSRLMLSACCKHFTAYDLDKWEGYDSSTFNAVVSQQDLKDTFQPPFKSCVEEGHASCMMCSYNQVNGVPACAHYDLYRTARSDWRFTGYIPSDCDAVEIIHEKQSYGKTPEDAVAAVLKAGMDINCGTYLLRHTISAIKRRKVEESSIDRALFNLFSVRMRLGLFDGDPKHQKYGNLGPRHVCSDEHRYLALEAAREGIVLLKNSGNILPLSKSLIASLAVIGPNANAPATLIGDYPGVPCKITTPLLGLQSYIQTILYAPGCEYVNCSSKEGFGEAARIAAKADAVVMVVGLDLSQETEGHDRVSLNLPGEQQNLVSEITRASKGPVVLVLMSGGPVDVSFAKTDPSISSILWVGYPGEAGGQALAQVIFGDYNPGGRLPMTWYPQAFTKVPMNVMNMRPNLSTGYPGRTYRFYTGRTVFQFGYGLSYSNYSYTFASTSINRIILPFSNNQVVSRNTEMASNHIYVDDDTVSCEKGKFNIQVSVHNHGRIDGSHAVLMFAKSPATHRGAPQRQLIGFKRVHVESGRSIEVQFLVNACDHLSTVTEDARRILSPGVHTFMTGDTQHLVTLAIENNTYVNGNG